MQPVLQLAKQPSDEVKPGALVQHELLQVSPHPGLGPSVHVGQAHTKHLVLAHTC